MESYQGESPKFKTPEEEINFLHKEIERKEKALAEAGKEVLREKIVSDHLSEYTKQNPKEVLDDGYQIKEGEAHQIVLELRPEEHDERMNELLNIMLEKGIKNAMLVASRMSSPHIDDDFHRFLVQYIKADYETKGLDKDKELFKKLHSTLYEITLPGGGKDEDHKSFKELVSSMEQFYAGMISVGNDDKNTLQNYFSMEIALSNQSDEVVFYSSVPDAKSDLFEKQVLASFPNAKILEYKDDYNIFNENGESSGSVARPSFSPALSLKTYDNFEHDPLNIILNVFSKMKHTGEGAAIQIVLSPIGDYHVNRYKMILEKVKEGVPIKEAIKMSDGFAQGFGRAFKEFALGVEKPKKNKDDAFNKSPATDEASIKNIEEKISSSVLSTNIRIIASAETTERADDILSDLESAFNQFSETRGNGIRFERLKKSSLREMLHRFSYRMFSKESNFPLSLKELTTIFHFPVLGTASPQLKEVKSGVAPAPLNIPKEGIVLGVNKYRHSESKIHFSTDDRMRHFYVVGQTGTGKTNLLKNMIAQDIFAGEGVCMIDPHGSDIEDILSIIPEERFGDVIYFDPSHTARPMGLNMLEYDRRFPEQKTFVVNELFSIFQKLYGGVPESMGPMFEQYFRNAAMLVIEDPDTGSTLLDVSRVLADSKFRELKLSKCSNPVVVQFWRDVASKAGGEGALQNIVPYITSKFDVFLANDIMRPIVAQEHSAFNFRNIMDDRKILLVNLSKGRLGDMNSSLIGLIVVGKILMATLSRIDGKYKPPEFYLYIDEFQNVTTDSISVILSEARKYRLSLNVAHQFIGQLDDGIRKAVFGNVGSMASFRVGAEDAEYLEKQFEPVFGANDIMNLDNYNAYLKLLINGQPAKPFSMTTEAFYEGSREKIEKIKELSYQKYGKDRKEIEEEIIAKYRV